MYWIWLQELAICDAHCLCYSCFHIVKIMRLTEVMSIKAEDVMFCWLTESLIDWIPFAGGRLLHVFPLQQEQAKVGWHNGRMWITVLCSKYMKRRVFYLFILKVKTDYFTTVGNANLLWTNGWVYHRVCDTWPVLLQTFCYILSYSIPVRMPIHHRRPLAATKLYCLATDALVTCAWVTCLLDSALGDTQILNIPIKSLKPWTTRLLDHTHITTIK